MRVDYIFWEIFLSPNSNEDPLVNYVLAHMLNLHSLMSRSANGNILPTPRFIRQCKMNIRNCHSHKRYRVSCAPLTWLAFIWRLLSTLVMLLISKLH